MGIFFFNRRYTKGLPFLQNGSRVFSLTTDFAECPPQHKNTPPGQMVIKTESTIKSLAVKERVFHKTQSTLHTIVRSPGSAPPYLRINKGSPRYLLMEFLRFKLKISTSNSDISDRKLDSSYHGDPGGGGTVVFLIQCTMTS